MKYKGKEIVKVYGDEAIGSCKNCVFNKESPCENLKSVGVDIDCSYSVYTIKLDFEKMTNDFVVPVVNFYEEVEKTVNAINDFSLIYLGISGKKFVFEEAVEQEEIIADIYNSIKIK